MFLSAFALLALASCKKDYTCRCTYSGTFNGTNTKTITDTRSDAKAECDKDDSSSNGQTYECELD